MTSFFEELRKMAAKKMTKADRERHKAFSEQMKKNTERTYELATQMKLEREARERREQRAS